MSSVHVTQPRVWVAAVLAGLVGGVGMGIVLHSTTNAMPLLGALYGQPTVVGGWLAHLFNSVVFALAFAAAVTLTPLRDYARSVATCAGLGVGYGALLGVVTGGLVLPVALNLVGATALPVPLWPVPGGSFAFGIFLAIGHLVYGLGLGAAFGVALAVLPTGAETETIAEH
ncbi:hypothetical protein [Halogranum amylolyticum]|nr:hypothetical protein [Halogranum amylolyticum]